MGWKSLLLPSKLYVYWILYNTEMLFNCHGSLKMSACIVRAFIHSVVGSIGWLLGRSIHLFVLNVRSELSCSNVLNLAWFMRLLNSTNSCNRFFEARCCQIKLRRQYLHRIFNILLSLLKYQIIIRITVLRAFVFYKPERGRERTTMTNIGIIL